MIVADIITFFYNKDGKNGKTMRNMPFDNDIDPLKQEQIIKMHSIMQIGATTFMLGDLETAFSPLIAIQLAAFLMTLVRKSIINAITWHSIYSLSLWINIILFKTHSTGYIFIQHIMINNFIYVFFPLKVNKYISWTINFGTFILYKEIGGERLINTLSDFYPDLVYKIKLVIIYTSFLHFFYKYRILFI